MQVSQSIARSHIRTQTLHIPPSHRTSYRQIRWAYTAGSAYTSPSSTAKIQLHLLTYAQQRCGHDHTPEPGPCNNHSVSAHFMAFIAFMASAPEGGTPVTAPPWTTPEPLSPVYTAGCVPLSSPQLSNCLDTTGKCKQFPISETRKSRAS